MIIKAPKIPFSSGAVSAVEQDGTVLTMFGGVGTVPHSVSPAVRRNTYHAALSTTLANLDMNAEIKFDLKNEDLKDLQELGQGNGGSVKKVEHVPTGTIMAKKVCHTFLLLLVSTDNSNHNTFRDI
jgi:mitogen-activated protein kinase kinase